MTCIETIITPKPVQTHSVISPIFVNKVGFQRWTDALPPPSFYVCREGGSDNTAFPSPFPLPMEWKANQVQVSIFHLIFFPSLICWFHIKSLCEQITDIHLVHFWVHHKGPSLRGIWFLQGNFNQWPVFLSGVRWRYEWGNDLPFLVSLNNNNNNKLKNNRICFWNICQASQKTEPQPQVWSLQHKLYRGIYLMGLE